MKNSLMLLQDKIALRKRALIETVNDELKTFAKQNIRAIVLLKILQLTNPLSTYNLFFDKKFSINLWEDIIAMKRITT